MYGQASEAKIEIEQWQRDRKTATKLLLKATQNIDIGNKHDGEYYKPKYFKHRRVHPLTGEEYYEFS